MSLFAWMTLANGDRTGLDDAETQAVAGKLNRQRIWVDPGQARPIAIRCWPQGTTSDIPDEREGYDIVVTGSRMRAPGAPPPPPPPPSAPERDSEASVALKAVEERLGDVRLYRIPEAVTVAAKSQKQVAMITQPSVKVESIVRLRPGSSAFGAMPMERLLVTRNRTAEGLGLPLPAGKLELFGRREGHRILIGEGTLDDRTVGEKVEIPVGTANGVLAAQTESTRDPDVRHLTLTNDLPRPQVAEIEFPLEVRGVSARLVKRDGWMLWRVVIPANGKAMLSYRYG
jgi:hypothetical protein